MNDTVSASPVTSEDQSKTDQARASMLVTLLTTESNLIWSRYAAMLTANAIVVGAIGIGLKETANHFLVLAGALLGLILSRLWYGLTIEGWRMSKAWIEAIDDIRIGGDSIMKPYFRWLGEKDNPSREVIHDKKKRDRFEKTALVIYLFVAAYVLALLVSLWPVLCRVYENLPPLY